MRSSTVLRGALGGAVAAAALGLCTPARAQSNLRHGIVYYVPAGAAVQAKVAARYDMGLIESHYGVDAVGVKALNPSFRWFVYNSATDNYVTPTDTEHQLLLATAAAKGWDPEEGYLHFIEDTDVRLENQVVHVPGWGQGSAATKAEARVPAYYADGSRRLLNFSTWKGRQLHKEVVVALNIDRPFTNSNLHADGVFLDNASHVPYNFGDVLSGGRVLEAPGNAKLGTTAFETFFWDQNLAPFLGALKDTLATVAAWGPDGRPKEIMINIGNSWTDEYTTRDVADVLCMEFQYSPIRNFGADMVLEAHRRDRLAAAAGMEVLYLSLVATEVGTYAGTYTYDEAMLGSVSWFLASRVPGATSLFLIGTFNPARADWDQVTWRGVLDTLEVRVGQPLEDPYILTSGTDPLGQPYTVTARAYDGGLAVVRNRGEWNQIHTPETAVTLTLPFAGRRLDVNGNAGASATTVSLRNGEGAIFLRGEGGVPPPPAGLPAPISDLGSAFRLDAVSPPQGATGVPPAAEVRFRLSDPIAPGGIPSGWITAVGSLGGPRAGTLRSEQGGRVLVFAPAAPWTRGERVTVTLSAFVRRGDGAYLDGNADGTGSGGAADGVTVTFDIAP